jgi:hypothetical protein
VSVHKANWTCFPFLPRKSVLTVECSWNITRFLRPGSTAILANAPPTLVEYLVSAVFCPISVQYRKSIKSRFTDADVSGYAAGIGEMQLSEI